MLDNSGTNSWARFFKARLAYSRSKRSCQFVSEYETDYPPNCLDYDVENRTSSHSFPFSKLVLVAGSEIEMKNFTDPGLA